VLPAKAEAGLIVILAVQIRKQARRNVNLAVARKVKRDQSILDVVQPLHNAKGTNAEAQIFKKKKLLKRSSTTTFTLVMQLMTT